MTRMDPNPDQERWLAAQTDALLKGLPPRKAPATLLPRVLAAIQDRAALPWYRQSWQMWPVAWRFASLLVLLGFFGGLCVAGWQLPQASAYASAARQLGHWFLGVRAVWDVLVVLSQAAAAVGKHLPTGFTVACLVSLGLGYGVCVGLGAAWLRFAFNGRSRENS